MESLILPRTALVKTNFKFGHGVHFTTAQIRVWGAFHYVPRRARVKEFKSAVDANLHLPQDYGNLLLV